MAEQIVITSLDDIDGSEAAERVRFALDGASYEIDLSEDNARGLREALTKYVRNARRVGGRKPKPAANGAAQNGSDDRELNRKIREWARQQGWDVSDRGRLSSTVIDAYHQSEKAS